jgi:hypothetical protein
VKRLFNHKEQCRREGLRVAVCLKKLLIQMIDRDEVDFRKKREREWKFQKISKLIKSKSLRNFQSFSIRN